MRTNRVTAVGLGLCIVALFGCGKLKGLTGGGGAVEAGATAVASGSAAPAAEEARIPEGAVCAVAEEKVWGKWANRRTGLTPTKSGGKLLLGVALGNRPYVLSFDAGGHGNLTKVALHSGSSLANEIPAKKGQRDLQRVTPSLSNGKLAVYADYRDKYADNQRRRIACEQVTERQALLVFDGKPLLEREKEKEKEKPAADTAKPATPSVVGRLKLPTRGIQNAPSAAPPASSAPAAEAPPERAQRPIREVRDCRTFVDSDGAVWAVGSELVGSPQPDGSHKWSMRFFAAPDAGRGFVTLMSVPLPKSPRDPKDLYTLEAPVAHELSDHSHVLSARYRGSLLAWSLSSAFKPRGSMRTYRGGYPSLPRFFDDGSPHLLVSQKVADDRWELRTALLSATLPRTLDKITLEGTDASLAEPSLARAGGERWLGFHAGTRRGGQLTIVPVDDKLNRAGRSYQVSGADDEIYESLVFGLSEGRLLAVMLRSTKDSGAELVSQVLSCSVRT